MTADKKSLSIVSEDGEIDDNMPAGDGSDCDPEICGGCEGEPCADAQWAERQRRIAKDSKAAESAATRAARKQARKGPAS